MYLGNWVKVLTINDDKIQSWQKIWITYFKRLYCKTVVSPTPLLSFCVWSGWTVKEWMVVMLALSQVKNRQVFVVNILLSNIQLCWSRAWNESFAHIENWRLLLWDEARSLLEWSIVIPGERRLLLHLLVLQVVHVVIVSLLAVEERIIVYMLISKHVLMVNASLFTQVINRWCSAFAL